MQAGYSRGGPQQSEGARRLLAAAEQGDRVDQRLWTAIARETGGQLQLHRAGRHARNRWPRRCSAYYDLGVTTFLIRGFDPLEDAIDYGRELIPRVRELVARRDAEASRKAAWRA